MKYILGLLFILIAWSLTGQETILNTKSSQTSNTRAVVFGISDYKDEEIIDLQYADKDARAFTEFLQSKYGGSLDENHLELHSNEKATRAQIASSLDWLLEESREGDLAIIYFAGHSDVEIKFKTNNGYLLSHDSPARAYTVGAFPLYLLKQYISAMAENNVQVVMISDACHAGKLAGSAEGGPSAALVNIAQSFNNEVKILSCQPEEFSMEGPQWGGGRGVFSYFLLEGLFGKADLNNDFKITLLEIRRYLEDMVPDQTAPHQQMPMTIGDPQIVLAKTDEAFATTQNESVSDENSFLGNRENNLIKEKRVLKNVKPGLKIYYEAFKFNIANGILMEPEGDCANYYFQVLAKEESMNELHDLMRRMLAVALQDEIQKERNKLLESLLTE